MPLLETLEDSFTGTLDLTKWPNSYGDPTATGGRGRIPCTVGGFAGLRSATAYTLADSHFLLRAYPPPALGAVSTAALSVLVLTGTGGTDAGFIIDTAQGAMGLYLREGYADGGALFPPYDPVAHAWLRLQDAGGTLLWEASPDSSNWTVLRSAPTPAWAADTNLSLLLESTRTDGSNNVAEIDNVNLPTSLVLLGAARTAAAARPVTGQKSVPLGATRSTSLARPLTAAHIVQLGTARTRGRAGTITRLPRPARTLAPSASGPALTPSTTGPQLAATSTTGG
ncbi:hypothetical protein A4E84_20215 [Streptomyces qaidamensis]|uniref:Uncharacterized protein n=1 Tax=Streptomyces qaidamensis TaxID=1783515 RepID=A0A143C2G1_9ACTN|nr:hypothetical protein [Streptomyces qaidamensis]AMW11613.1 hypothetical protein A4E84_20215 [Streptomyces qaidamensis]